MFSTQMHDVNSAGNSTDPCRSGGNWACFPYKTTEGFDLHIKM